MTFQYRFPRIYGFLIGFLYSRSLLEAIARAVGRGRNVFDIAAGYGRMAGVIDASNRYHGIDLNEAFVRFGRRKGRDLAVADILDPKAYTPADVFLVVDIVHHLEPAKRVELFDLIFPHAKERVVVVEPAFVGVTRRLGPIGRAIGWLFRYVDSDGFNRITHWLTNDEYQELFDARFGSVMGKNFTMTRTIVGHHHLVIFERKN